LMGVHKNIGFEKFPKQGKVLGDKVWVAFHYQPDKKIEGVIVRDDMDDPYRTIIKLNDGRHVMAKECHYSFAIPRNSSRRSKDA